MIYTITVNPSIDYVLQLENLNTGEVNRTSSDVKLPGGKGINVSRILKALDIDSTALGFVGGATGSMFEELLAQHELKTAFTKVQEDTRINVKINATAQNEETEINGAGPSISASLAVTPPLNLPAPGRCQALYLISRFRKALCFC